MGAAERSGVRGIPVVAFAGYSGSGKTTVIAALIPHLRRRGLRVAVVKHAAHSFDMSHPGKDSWQFSQAGAEVSVISSPEQTALVERRALQLAEVLERIRDVDLILVEGHKNEPLTQIGVCRAASGNHFTAPVERFIAVVSDLEELSLPVPVFTFGDTEALAGFLAERKDMFTRFADGILEHPANTAQAQQ